MNNQSSAPTSRRQPKLKAVLSLWALLLLAAPSFAETVAVPLGQQGKAWNIDAPRTGLNMSEVQARFGEPLSQAGPVGDPPIFTWVYGQFTVYFEGDRVIHSVIKYTPEQTR